MFHCFFEGLEDSIHALVEEVGFKKRAHLGSFVKELGDRHESKK